MHHTATLQVTLTFEDFEATFRNFSKTSIRFMMVNKTPVFIGCAPWIEALSRGVLNQRIRSRDSGRVCAPP